MRPAATGQHRVAHGHAPDARGGTDGPDGLVQHVSELGQLFQLGKRQRGVAELERNAAELSPFVWMAGELEQRVRHEPGSRVPGRHEEAQYVISKRDRIADLLGHLVEQDIAFPLRPRCMVGILFGRVSKRQLHLSVHEAMDGLVGFRPRGVFEEPLVVKLEPRRVAPRADSFQSRGKRFRELHTLGRDLWLQRVQRASKDEVH